MEIWNCLLVSYWYWYFGNLIRMSNPDACELSPTVTRMILVRCLSLLRSKIPVLSEGCWVTVASTVTGSTGFGRTWNLKERSLFFTLGYRDGGSWSGSDLERIRILKDPGTKNRIPWSDPELHFWPVILTSLSYQSNRNSRDGWFCTRSCTICNWKAQL